VLFAWAVFWWGFAGLTQMDRAEDTIGAWQFAIVYLGVSAAAAALLRARLAWPRLNWLVALIAVLGLPMVAFADDEFGSPLAPYALPGWGVFAGAIVYALWQAREVAQRSVATAHLALLWLVGLAVTLQLDHFADANGLAQGWRFLAIVAPGALMTLALWRIPALAAWPRAAAFPRYQLGWFFPVCTLLALAWLIGLFSAGDATPLAYVPLLNPLELSLLGLALLLGGMVRASKLADSNAILRFWPLVGFAFVTLATLRAVHHLHGEPWGSVLDSGFSQSALTLVWSVIGVVAWVRGSRTGNRTVWKGGALLITIVLAKLLLVDRLYLGNLTGIVSFGAVGFLLIAVGWIAPAPPKLPVPANAAAGSRP
jgi:uncharacterized membrane protein